MGCSCQSKSQWRTTIQCVVGDIPVKGRLSCACESQGTPVEVGEVGISTSNNGNEPHCSGAMSNCKLTTRGTHSFAHEETTKPCCIILIIKAQQPRVTQAPRFSKGIPRPGVRSPLEPNIPKPTSHSQRSAVGSPLELNLLGPTSHMQRPVITSPLEPNLFGLTSYIQRPTIRSPFDSNLPGPTSIFKGW
ncbi:hypothetical protein AMTR_s00008p00127680 [Amborella trichopoda]|uniref:Uncharacterized protein n=1 Tax=Amborella trichopoda TaxID=13333 RepID=W1NII3_AMBTC|nr:hypothetical protein AMTR_s00008p00127680 [Amborella trichopoda]